MRLRVLVLACAAMACSFTSAAGRDPTVLTPAQTKVLVDKATRQSMVFFVAKGEANACGPGCSEWIAAEGVFEPTTSQRFKDFLAVPSRRDLPIFFSSDGGDTQQAILMAVVLREHRMRAGVAHTLPEGCRGAVATDQACRRLVQAKDEVKAKLLTKGAKCGSACGFAFVGASFRQIAADARFHIHSSAFTNDKAALKAKDWLPQQKRLFMYLGIDPGWVDLINTVPFDRPRAMSRDEIARFGIETRGVYETQWLLGKTSTQSQQFWISKSVTQPQGPGSGEYRTTSVFIGCPSRWGIPFNYRRELSKNEGNGRATMRFSGAALEMSPRPPEQDTEIKFTSLSAAQLRQAAAEPTIELSEQLWLQGEYRARVTKLSTAGLSKAFEDLLRLCDDAKPTVASAAPAQAVARGFSETPWTLEKSNPQFPQHFFVRKSVTQPENTGSNEYRTTRITIACADPHGLLVTYRRELSKGEGVGSAIMHVGGSELQLATIQINADVEVRRALMKLDLLQKAIAEPAIEISERRWLQGEYKSRVTKISTAGLSDLPERCGSKSSAAPGPPAQATAR